MRSQIATVFNGIQDLAEEEEILSSHENLTEVASPKNNFSFAVYQQPPVSLNRDVIQPRHADVVSHPLATASSAAVGNKQPGQLKMPTVVHKSSEEDQSPIASSAGRRRKARESAREKDKNVAQSEQNHGQPPEEAGE